MCIFIKSQHVIFMMHRYIHGYVHVMYVPMICTIITPSDMSIYRDVHYVHVCILCAKYMHVFCTYCTYYEYCVYVVVTCAHNNALYCPLTYTTYICMYVICMYIQYTVAYICIMHVCKYIPRMTLVQTRNNAYHEYINMHTHNM